MRGGGGRVREKGVKIHFVFLTRFCFLLFRCCDKKKSKKNPMIRFFEIKRQGLILLNQIIYKGGDTEREKMKQKT